MYFRIISHPQQLLHGAVETKQFGQPALLEHFGCRAAPYVLCGRFREEGAEAKEQRPAAHQEPGLKRKRKGFGDSRCQ
jgi:hypothetical protein